MPRCLAAVFTIVLLGASSARVWAASPGTNPPNVDPTPALTTGPLVERVAASLLVNGDFETSLFNPGACLFNWPNAGITANVPGITAYGAANEIDYTTAPNACGFGLSPQGGVAKICIHRKAPQFGAVTDEFSIAISGGVVAGTAYTLTFYATSMPVPDPDIGSVDIGLSSNASDFGTPIYTSPPPSTTSWTLMSTTFQAPANASYLTVRVSLGVTAMIHLDTFSLEPVGATPLAHRSWGATKIRYRD
jgi:hypothetical protein